jgi:two-component system, cell cycle sensor histidine kinase and response regulator CckA
MSDEPRQKYKLLIIDDNPTIHADIKKILCPIVDDDGLSEEERALFGSDSPKVDASCFDIDSAFQGRDGLKMVQEAAEKGQPYALAFVDVRMPPGWDGVETIRHIWAGFPDLQVVICTAYSDHSWVEIIRQLGHSDSLVILKKPFDNIEVLQLAHALTKKWTLTHQARTRMGDLDDQVRQRTVELSRANEELQAEVRKRAEIEIALRASEERFERAFRAASVPMAILHLHGRMIADVNNSFVTLVGAPREAIVGKTMEEMQFLSEPESFHAALQDLSRGKQVRNLKCAIRRRVGDARQTLLSLEPVLLGGEDCLLLAMHDVTDQVQLEAQLRQSQKMEAIGQLAAGVAHDFNNLLTIIGGYTSLQISRDNLDEELAYSLHQVKNAADRAAALTKQLLAFSRKQVMHRRSLDLSDVIQQVHPMLVRMVGESITLAYDTQPFLPPVLADKNCLEQVIMNLVVNARDASSAGGTVFIRANVVELKSSEAQRVPDARAGRFVCLSVQDRGCGIETTLINRLFEPFFTTKPNGKGTGLGLSTVYGIARQHDGWVEVASKHGEGSTFSVFLPLSEKPVEASVETSFVKALQRDAVEPRTILVAEDEHALRELMACTLARHGYNILQAADGAEALTVWRSSKTPIDLLLTDMVMPNGISGAELASTLLKESETLRVVYVSGYSAEVLNNGETLIEGRNFLSKPFSFQKLLRTVEQIFIAEPANPLAAVRA